MRTKKTKAPERAPKKSPRVKMAEAAPERIYSIPEAADFHNVTRTCILIACQEGRIAGQRVGRFWIIRESVLKAWKPRAYQIRRGPRPPVAELQPVVSRAVSGSP